MGQVISRQWNQHLFGELKNGLEQYQTGHFILRRIVNGEVDLILAVHVDDNLLQGVRKV